MGTSATSCSKTLNIGSILLLIAFCILPGLYAYTQVDPSRPTGRSKQNIISRALEREVTSSSIDGQVYQAIVKDGDTLLLYELEEIVIFAPREFSNRFQQMRYNRLVRNVKKVYPYAKIAGQKYQEYNEMLQKEENERRRNALMRKAENELREDFESELRRLTFSQGLILVKLVDRETQNTTYDVVKEFRGVFSAVFWQGLGRLFGYNLKTKYDAKGEDYLIEEIIMMIEAGAI